MDDAIVNVLPAALGFGEANAQQIGEIVRWYCEACQSEKLSKFMIAPCGCFYCEGCVNVLFELAAKCELNFPPKCCGLIITLEIAQEHLSVDVYTKFQEVFEEFSTTKRIYCSDPECAKFISPTTIDGGPAKCPACQKLTCIVCNGEAHEGNCLEDPGVESFMTTVAQAGFQQCRECKRVIELKDGCYHITCICSAEFCYRCGAKWEIGSCACLNEGNGEDQAEESDDDDGTEDLDDEEREGMLQFALENVERIHPDGRIEWLH